VQTRLTPHLLDTAAGSEAESILRACVHCGFCNATCPTYGLLGDERDGPRGRIYLIKQMLEGQPVTDRTQQHLDRCLTCLACETTCPSGVRYGRLAEIGRGILNKRVRRPLKTRLLRRLLLHILLQKRRFTTLVRLGRLLRPLLPARLGKSIPPGTPVPTWPAPAHSRRMLLLEGCVQGALAPRTDAAAARVLDRAGISLVYVGGGCCGALPHHLNAETDALDAMRRNIDAWWPHLEAGAEAIVTSASACSLQVKDYGRLLAHDHDYADKASRISVMTRDLTEVVRDHVTPIPSAGRGRRVAFHPPCTLQHGLKLRGVVEKILTAAGFELVPVPDPHLCCGSAGTYSILQPELSRQLQAAKLTALSLHAPDIVATANVGCQHHLQAGTDTPVYHWIELLDDRSP
jgi:glycolate oxidase iron-sulfur subunit